MVKKIHCFTSNIIQNINLQDQSEKLYDILKVLARFTPPPLYKQSKFKSMNRTLSICETPCSTALKNEFEQVTARTVHTMCLLSRLWYCWAHFWVRSIKTKVIYILEGVACSSHSFFALISQSVSQPVSPQGVERSIYSLGSFWSSILPIEIVT